MSVELETACGILAAHGEYGAAADLRKAFQNKERHAELAAAARNELAEKLTNLEDKYLSAYDDGFDAGTAVALRAVGGNG